MFVCRKKPKKRKNKERVKTHRSRYGEKEADKKKPEE